MNKKIIFRADGTSKTGLGHLYRLFALAEMFRTEYDFLFLTKEDTVLKVIPKHYMVKLIPKSTEIDKEPEWLYANFSPEYHIVVADGYQFVSSYQKKIKDFNFTLVYVDDLLSEHMYADLVINHSPHAKLENYKKESYTQFALGTDYAILRPLFLKKSIKETKEQFPNNAFICFGGSDYNNFTIKTIRQVLKIDGVNRVNVVVGAAYDFKETYALEKQNSKVSVFKNLDEENLYRLMNTSTFAIVPASTVLFELISVNTYLLSGYYVENQKMAYQYLDKRNIFRGLGDFNDFDFSKLGDILSHVSINDIEKQIENQKTLIDGNQKNRFLELMNKLN
ncbi:UDP-2,4-diacetamido-2,4,6-trideoxy-beta-L-altropyranose hydrolase [Maribacter sp. 4U21]|uniref:UDP-2,4-diacetamido-2,4, 6-trideoxy-beta-L-altropyranose hydrolase n=1 Tax=Maribacter sp. 4U21 TaxID=1889779 RepID=UPI000C14AC3B|nr:UDP-2,4-diacetamido-2,4,6-trideoxy-beta-L-altropyranose hydrolase [Maribacter sp. 4U21]PIB28694.1 UDP-2,4-diacetamido-2,4,6-trideoxy-beta-L-altropyranose hydrolase [Maribacter sp. 4U21]